MRVFLKGFNSCPQREQKLEQYAAFLRANGHRLVEQPEDSEALVLWTCGFRADVRDNCLEQLEAVGARAPAAAECYAVGCLPQIAPGQMTADRHGQALGWIEEAELEAVFRTQGGAGLEDVRTVMAKPAVCADADAYRKAHPGAAVTFHDQFNQIVVSEGCPFKCTYCSERLAFPKYRSMAPDAIEAAVRQVLAASATGDFMLVADSLGEYGSDIGTSLPALIGRLCAVAPTLRIACNNLHPMNLMRDFDAYLPFIAAGRIAHLNLPIQSGSTTVLQRMRRLYDRAGIEALFARLRQAGFADYDTHVIVGFPGETEHEFAETLEVVEAIRPRYVMVSAFMNCEDAPAAAMPDHVDEDIIERRMVAASDRFRGLGIRFTAEGSEAIRDRLARINQRAAEGLQISSE